MKKLLPIAVLALAPSMALAAPSDRANELAQRFIIVDGHVDAPLTIAEAGADMASGDKAVDFDYARAKAGVERRNGRHGSSP